MSDLRGWAQRAHISDREPDEFVPNLSDPYMLRWFAWRKHKTYDTSCTGWIDQVWPFSDATPENVYVHRFLRSDEDRALHDHPWRWVSVLLEGHYFEHVPVDLAEPAGPTVARLRQAGDIVVCSAADQPHRIELDDGLPVTTFFLTANKCREWGFWCGSGWRHWRTFVARDETGRIRGCE